MKICLLYHKYINTETIALRLRQYFDHRVKHQQSNRNHKRRNTMKSSIRDKAEGAFREAKGKAREMAGQITDNPKLEAKGKAENIAGKAQEKIGQVKKVLGK